MTTPLPSLWTLARETLMAIRGRFAAILALSSLSLLAIMLCSQVVLLLPVRLQKLAVVDVAPFIVVVLIQLIWQAGIILLVHGERSTVLAVIGRSVRNLWQLFVATTLMFAIAGIPLLLTLALDLRYGTDAQQWTKTEIAVTAVLVITFVWFLSALTAVLIAPYRIVISRERGLHALLHSWQDIQPHWMGIGLRYVSFTLLLIIATLLLSFLPTYGTLLSALALTPLSTVFGYRIFRSVCDHEPQFA